MPSIENTSCARCISSMRSHYGAIRGEGSGVGQVVTGHGAEVGAGCQGQAERRMHAACCAHTQNETCARQSAVSNHEGPGRQYCFRATVRSPVRDRRATTRGHARIVGPPPHHRAQQDVSCLRKCPQGVRLIMPGGKCCAGPRRDSHPNPAGPVPCESTLKAAAPVELASLPTPPGFCMTLHAHAPMMS